LDDNPPIEKHLIKLLINNPLLLPFSQSQSSNLTLLYVTYIYINYGNKNSVFRGKPLFHATQTCNVLYFPLICMDQHLIPKDAPLNSVSPKEAPLKTCLKENSPEVKFQTKNSPE